VKPVHYNWREQFFHLVAYAPTVIPMLLCTGSLWLWWRSYTSGETLVFPYEYRASSGGGKPSILVSRRLASATGRLEISYSQLRTSDDCPSSSFHWWRWGSKKPRNVIPRHARARHRDFLGFTLSTYNSVDQPQYVSFVLPYWSIVSCFAVLPGVHLLRRLRQSRRRRFGLCMHCGYDLRASGGRCPECGQ
jgi:hypothetical protein